MEVDGAEFKPVIQNILNRWTALKMVVEHQMGGRLSHEKALYLTEYLHEIFMSNQSVEAEDLEDLLIEYMDSECNTVLEDDSPLEVSRTLVRLYDVFSKSGVPAVEAELRTLPPVAEWLNPNLPAPSVRNGANEEGVDDGSEGSVSDDSADDDEPMEAVEADDGWTKVTYGNKR